MRALFPVSLSIEQVESPFLTAAGCRAGDYNHIDHNWFLSFIFCGSKHSFPGIAKTS